MPPDIIERCQNNFYMVNYGCEKKSNVVYSLNHVIVASFSLDSDLEFPKSDRALLMVQNKKGAHICTQTSLQDAEDIFICPIWMWQVLRGDSFNHDITA